VSNRLVLLSGTPRAGTTTLARAASRAAERAGYTTSLITLDDSDLVERRRLAWPRLCDVMHVLAPDLSLENRTSDDFVTLPGVDELLILQSLADRLGPGGDVVIVDGGQVEELLRLVTWLETVDELLNVLATPSAVDGVGPASDALIWVRGELGRIRSALFDAQATVRLVTTPDDAAGAQLCIAGITLAGFHVDGVIVNKVPSKKGDWPKRWAKEQRARAKRVDFGELPVANVRLRTDDRVTGLSLARHFGLDTAWTAQPMNRVEADGDGYVWSVPLIDPADQPVRVGYRESSLLIEVGRYRRQLPMPSVVQRCIVTEAQVWPDSVRLVCQPDTRVWPS
jgi:arsenite/tail-anchored protein-transporting ATPase